MAVTRTTIAARRERERARVSLTPGLTVRPDTVSLLAASLVVACGLVLVYSAKTREFASIDAALTRGDVVNLNRAVSIEQLERVLTPVPAGADRRFAADQLLRGIANDAARHGLENVGALVSVRVSEDVVQKTQGIASFHRRLAELPARTDARPRLVTVLPLSQFVDVKPKLIVRTPSEFRRSVLLHVLLYLAAIYGVQMFWRARGVPTDPVLLAAVHVLTGLGLIAMLSLRDPLRDVMLFTRSVQGIAAGAVLMALASRVNYQTSALRRLSLIPLAVAILLSILLVMFGTGPGGSDAKVNLLGVQPVEAIRVLLVLFLAGYFANRWRFLRDLRERPGRRTDASGQHSPSWLEVFRVPRLDHALPVFAGVAFALVFFFLQSDLGPALVFTCVFLALYGISRRAGLLVTVGLATLCAGFLIGYWLQMPRTVAARIQMWLSPWENGVRGGDQVAHALWAFAAGARSGTGLGLGEPAFIPTAHTDMVLAALGEELGFVGIACAAMLYLLVAWRGFTIARNASGPYGFFLATGLTLTFVVQVLLISAGILGVAPLSGVVTPFLSYGRSAMLANFTVVGILIGIFQSGTARRDASIAATPDTPHVSFAEPMRWLVAALSLAAIIVMARVALVQAIRADQVLARSALSQQADGGYRYQENPRLRMAATTLPRGGIHDRNGIPLATANWDELQRHKTTYAALGVSPDAACRRDDTRCYPFGSVMFHLLGDVRSRVNWGAPNTSYEERDSDDALRGFDDHAELMERTGPDGRAYRLIHRDYRELIPLWRYRYRPQHASVQRLRGRKRDLRMTIDARLQVRLARALQAQLARSGLTRGALVVMDPSSGDVLASVSVPAPAIRRDVWEKAEEGSDPALLDRARYGVYPPGSTFKIVTAAAALTRDTGLRDATFACRRLPDGRVGNYVRGWSRPIRDDELDAHPHGVVDMQEGMIVSCNAYFAQLGLRAGASALHAMAHAMDITVAHPDTADRLRNTLPQAAYGQGEVLATPFKLTRATAAIAAGGAMPYGRWVGAAEDRRNRPPVHVMSPEVARTIASYMRNVVVRGTGRALAGHPVPIAGKTGTAEVDKGASHAWFTGFAPYGTREGRRIAFTILVENGGYGGRTAAPLAAEIVTAARQYGYVTP